MRANEENWNRQFTELINFDGDLANIGTWAEKHAYDIVWTAKNTEFRLTKKDLSAEEAPFDLVFRKVYDSDCNYQIELKNSLPETLPACEIRLTLGLSLKNPMVFPLWKAFRLGAMKSENDDNISICTRLMPSIVGGILRDHYGINDITLLCEMTRKLLPFGSKYFGKKEFEMPVPTSPWGVPLSFDWETPFYVCYAPGELEAIAGTCFEILQNAKTVESLRSYDMNRFKRLLSEKTLRIRPTADIAIFGRKIYGSGLKEYDSALMMSLPLHIS